jgi:hypothetical protein
VYGELGRFPLGCIKKMRIIKFWFKIKQKPDSLLNKLLLDSDDVNSHITNWGIKLKILLQDLGLPFLYYKSDITTSDVNCICQRIKDISLQTWVSDIDNLPKLDTYRLFKSNFDFENYLDIVVNNRDRICLTRLRCSAHSLFIEEGRYRNIPRNERVCTRCNMGVIENEYHFLLICPLYRDLRKLLLP